MKKIVSIFALFVAVCFSTSCSSDKCYHCELLVTSQDLCESETGSASALESAVDALELLGFTCTEK